ncbi:MFS transporter [Allokutzneria multivorans]|uniref:MFS transporter n=1 Tax=Allokutzneria multivorans TaxID=1142134 RepID=A0ABP7RLB2_9PSEU
MGGNTALRRLLSEAGLSSSALARAIVKAGAEQGIHLGTSTTSVTRMLDGCLPRSPVPRLVAQVLSRRLGYPVRLPDCGWEARADDDSDTFDGFRYSRSIDGTIDTVAELSGRDVNRRNFLLGSGFAAAAFSEPAFLATALPPEPGRAPGNGDRIGLSDVQALQETVRHFERQGRRYGGGATREQVVHLLHHNAARVLHGRYSDDIAPMLYSTVAQATWLAGLTSVDAGRHALARRYYAQALNLATHADDRPYAANVLAEMSRMTVDVAQATTDAAEATRSGQHAAALARSALRVAEDRATPAVTAYLHAIEARCFAFLGDSAATITATENARKAFERKGNPEPEWLGFYGETDLLSDVGQCLRDAGRPRQGTAMLERALHALPPDRATAKAKTRIHLAAAYVELEEYEHAEAVTSEALSALGTLSSARAEERIKGLHARVLLRGKDLSTLDEKLREWRRSS